MQDKGRKYEKNLAKEMGTKANPGSGNIYSMPGDIKTKEFLIESKFTGSPYYVFDLDYWAEHERDAMLCGKVPVMVLGFHRGKEYAIMAMGDYRPLEHHVHNHDEVERKWEYRKGTSCARLAQKKLFEVKRISSNRLKILIVEFSTGDEFVIMPKQTFYDIKHRSEHGDS